MSTIERINQFHKTKLGYATFASLELFLLYVFVSISIDTASMWAYLVAVLLLIGFVRNVVMLAIVLRRQQPNGPKK